MRVRPAGRPVNDGAGELAVAVATGAAQVLHYCVSSMAAGSWRLRLSHFFL